MPGKRAPSDEQIEAMFKSYDTNGNKLISFDEFIKCFAEANPTA